MNEQLESGQLESAQDDGDSSAASKKVVNEAAMWRARALSPGGYGLPETKGSGQDRVYHAWVNNVNAPR